MRLLDYEVEIGLVIGREMPVGTTITEANLADYVVGLVVTNDVSARDVQLTKTQFYEAKSYPTFTPSGPRWCCWTPTSSSASATCGCGCGSTARSARTARRRRHHLPARAGTAGAVALSAPGCRRPGIHRNPGRHRNQRTGQANRDHRVAASRPAEVEAFFSSAAKNPKYLRHGDIIEAGVATDDGAIDLGAQRTVVKYA